jgi:adenylate cyclase
VAGTRKIPLQEGDTLIGRDPAAHVRVEADVSRRHACITLSQAGAVIEDLGSKNGTRVNEGPLQGPTRLSDGDRVGIGATMVVFHALASGRSTETLANPARSKKRKTSD